MTCIYRWLSSRKQLGGLVPVPRLGGPLRCKAGKFYTVPHNNVGNLNRATVLSFPKDKLRCLQKENTHYILTLLVIVVLDLLCVTPFSDDLCISPLKLEFNLAFQVLEMYSSGGDLHLELPSGETEGPQTLWQIPPYQTKSVMKANFVARLENNHTAYIR